MVTATGLGSEQNIKKFADAMVLWASDKSPIANEVTILGKDELHARALGAARVFLGETDYKNFGLNSEVNGKSINQ